MQSAMDGRILRQNLRTLCQSMYRHSPRPDILLCAAGRLGKMRRQLDDRLLRKNLRSLLALTTFLPRAWSERR